MQSFQEIWYFVWGGILGFGSLWHDNDLTYTKRIIAWFILVAIMFWPIFLDFIIRIMNRILRYLFQGYLRPKQ